MIIQAKQLNEDARHRAFLRWNRVAKPLHALGQFEDMITRIAAIQDTENIRLAPRSVLVFCGDHGVVRQHVSQSQSYVTRLVAGSIADGTSNINLMAEAAHARVIAVDMGMEKPLEVPGILSCRQGCGTRDISLGPAMTRAQAESAIQAGIDLVGTRAEQGDRLLATGEMGIGNTTSATALACALLHLPPDTVTGRGSGLSDAMLAHKKEIIEQALAVNHPDTADPVSVLAALGGFEIAGMTGAFLGAAGSGIPIVIDGVISAVSALIAARICPDTRHFLLASHVSREPVAAQLLDELQVTPVIHGDMALGEGTGAVMLFPLLDMAASVYNGTHTFEHLGMEAYTPLGGTT